MAAILEFEQFVFGETSGKLVPLISAVDGDACEKGAKESNVFRMFKSTVVEVEASIDVFLAKQHPNFRLEDKLDPRFHVLTPKEALLSHMMNLAVRTYVKALCGERDPGDLRKEINGKINRLTQRVNEQTQGGEAAQQASPQLSLAEVAAAQPKGSWKK